ncbi:MAG: SH3 domain-containing protein [Clostridia bacterium]|nr:SH3 domain-containing protein [Clostridia bacterium]
MKRVWKMLLAALLCLTLIVPAGAMAEETGVRYGVCTDNQVNVRKTAGPNGAVWFKVDQGHVAEITGETTVGETVWYKVNTAHPTPNGRTYVGYIMSDFFREMTAAEVEAYLKDQEVPDTDDGENNTEMQPSVDDALQGGDHTEYSGLEVTGAKGRVKSDSNFRSEPSTKTGTVYEVIAKDTEVVITGVPQEGDTNGWYRVVYDSRIGYIFCDQIEMLDEGTMLPGYGTEVTGVVGQVTTEKVNFRASPYKDPDNANVIAVLYPGLYFDILTIPDQKTENDWYRVSRDGRVGYIQANFVKIVSGMDDEYGTEVTGVKGEVTTTNVNFRSEPRKDDNNANVIRKLDPGMVFDILAVPEQIDENHWYRVRWGYSVGYIQANFVRVVSGEVPDPGLPDDDGDDEITIVATGEVTADKVNFRSKPNVTASIYGKVHTGTIVQLLSIPTKVDADHWYKVQYDGKTGYIQSPFIRVLMVDEDELPEPERFGYARLEENSVNLRATAGGETVVQWKGKGSLLRITGEPISNGNYEWYPVYYPSTHAIYYVREDMIQVMAVEGGTLVTPTPGPDSPWGYVITTERGVNLRINPGEASLAQVPKNTILACVGPAQDPAESGTSYTWYKVKYNGMTGWLRGDCVRVCTSTGGDVAGDPENTPTPTPPDDGSVIYGYIRLTKNNVNLRTKPLGASQVQLPIDLILPVIGPDTPAGEAGQYCWYHVMTADGKRGYIRGDCAVPSDEGGTEITPTPTPGGSEVTGVKGKLLKNTNFRDEAGYQGSVMSVIPAGTVVDVLTVPADKVNGWYKITYDGKTGYVLGSLIKQVDADEPTSKPPVSAYGYVMINADKVNFRNKPAGKQIYKQLEKGTVWPMTGVAEDVGGVRWYPINVNGQNGYVHGDFSFKLSPTQEQSYLAGNGVPEEGPNPEEVLTSYVITTYKGVNLRESYSLDATKAYQVEKGTVMLFTNTKEVGTETWYCIVYENRELWVHGNFVKVMTLAEYQEWVAEHPDEVPDPNANLGYLKLIMDNVYIRSAAAGTTIVDQLRLGTILPYFTEKISAGNYYWYRVQTPAGDFGYIRADMVTKCDANGDPLPTPTPDLGDLSQAPKMQQETSYYQLKLGSTGVRVTNLVQELINQGYYTGPVTSNYTTDVQTAVKLFQSVNGLTVDGVAGSATQHALFGTRPIGAGDTSNLDFSIYPVEKIDWYTGGIQEMLPRGAKFKIYDVKTGIVWWAYRQAGSRHMDIETLTKADSDRLCEIYGVDNLQQIVTGNMWERRPCLVTIGTRTFACSLDGMQHGTDTISNNGMDGQVCLHFTNSEGHESKEVSESHRKAIEYAYNNCPAGKK